MSDFEDECDYEIITKACSCRKEGDRKVLCTTHKARYRELFHQVEKMTKEFETRVRAVQDKLTEDCQPVNDEISAIRSQLCYHQDPEQCDSSAQRCGELRCGELYAILREKRIQAEKQVQDIEHAHAQQCRPLRDEMQDIHCFREE